MTYRDLIVWQKSMGLVTEIYRFSQDFPQSEVFGLSAQLRRSAVSIPSNIAEGYGRNSTQEYLRFLRISCGSLYELQTQLESAANLEYFTENVFHQLSKLSQEIEKMLNSLIRKLQIKSDCQ